jgi:hypothetical protein
VGSLQPTAEEQNPVLPALNLEARDFEWAL